MASSKQDRYRVNDRFRGLMIIVSNVNFSGSADLERKGNDKDVDRLKNTFSQLGFEFQILEDQTCLQMFQAMIQVSKSNMDEYDCLAVVILTHGDDGNLIYGVDLKEDPCSLDDILHPLKDIKKEMPKLVFVQACRGNKLDEGHYVHANDSGNKKNENCIRVPIESDFLYHFSTSPGYFSFRNSLKGSVFIQSLCDVFDECIGDGVEIDVIRCLVRVNRRVADGYTSYVTDEQRRVFHNRKQMPSFMCMLRKDFFMKKQA